LSERLAGFTLIELLIVVAIIGILAAIAIPNFLQAQVRAKVAATVADFQALATGLESYRVDNPMYPPQGPGGGGGADRLVVLSTPVAYLKSPRIVDPFCPEKTGDVYYRYTNCSEANQIPDGLRNITRWMLRGRAPDGTFVRTQNLFNPEDFKDAAFYDPTNGTTSAGDVVRTVRGMEK